MTFAGVNFNIKAPGKVDEQHFLQSADQCDLPDDHKFPGFSGTKAQTKFHDRDITKFD